MSLCLASELEPDCPINYHHIIKMNLALKCLHHPQEPLDMLCLQPACEKVGLVCYLCKVEEHTDHNPLLPLKIFLGELLDKSSDSQEFVKETAMIDKELLSIQQRFLLLRSKMAAPNLADQAFLNFWKETLASINHFDRMIIELKDILADRGDDLIKELNQWVRKNGGHYSQKDEESKDNAYVGFLKGKLDSLKTVRQQIQKYDLRSSFEDSDILSLFVTHTAVKFFRLRFSEELKGICMTISSPTRASMTVHGNQRMMLLQPHLGTTRSVKRWKVKIQKLASWIGVGVAHLDTIKGVNFDFSYTNANHGNYLISSNGYSWNGYKMEFNSKYETFQYTTGDTIEVTYDPTANKVSFKKEGGEATFSYDVDPSQKPIHAAINLTGVGDAVQIIL